MANKIQNTKTKYKDKYNLKSAWLCKKNCARYWTAKWFSFSTWLASSRKVAGTQLWKKKRIDIDIVHVNNNNYYLGVAHPQSGSSSTWFLVEIEFGNVGFWREGKTGVPGEKISRSKGENQQQTQPTYGVDAGIWTWATLRGRRALSPLRYPLLPRGAQESKAPFTRPNIFGTARMKKVRVPKK